jgi:hypothetical protein
MCAYRSQYIHLAEIEARASILWVTGDVDHLVFSTLNSGRSSSYLIGPLGQSICWRCKSHCKCSGGPRHSLPSHNLHCIRKRRHPGAVGPVDLLEMQVALQVVWQLAPQLAEPQLALHPPKTSSSSLPMTCGLVACRSHNFTNFDSISSSLVGPGFGFIAICNNLLMWR